MCDGEKQRERPVGMPVCVCVCVNTLSTQDCKQSKHVKERRWGVVRSEGIDRGNYGSRGLGLGASLPS